MRTYAVSIALGLLACTKSDPGSRADAWFASVMGAVKLGVTTDDELLALLGAPAKSWDHGGGLVWYRYSGPAPFSRRFYATKGVVDLLHLEADRPAAVSPARALELLGDWKPRDATVSIMEGRAEARFIGRCGLPRLPEHGVMFLFLGDQLMEASISPFAHWEFASQVCAVP